MPLLPTEAPAPADVDLNVFFQGSAMVNVVSWSSRPTSLRRAFGVGVDFRQLPGLAVAACLIAASAFAPPATAQGLTLSERPDRWVVQHAGGAGELQVSGSTTSAAAVEARVVEALGAAEVVPWTVVDAAPFGGAWSGALTGIPAGGWYRLEARSAEDPLSSVAASGTFGVGLVVAAIGQSNMVKMFTEDGADGSLVAPFEEPADLTHRYGYGEPPGFEYARPRTVDVPVSWGPVTGTGGIRLANALSAELAMPVLVLDFSLDWTSLPNHWNNDLHRSWRRFSEALDLVGEIGVVVWHQGAHDAHENQPTVASYKVGLDALYRRITDRVGGFGTLPMLVAIQNRGDYDLLLSKDPTYDEVRQAQREWIAGRAHGFAAGDSNDLDITNQPGKGDGHFFAADYEEMADRMVRGVLHAFGRPGFVDGVDGPVIAGATVRGTTVQVEVAHDAGRRLRLESPGLDIEGFTVTDGEWLIGGGAEAVRNELEILSATLSDDRPGNWVELELAEAPAGPLRLRYLYGQNPFYAKSTPGQRRINGNTLYDDFTYRPGRSGLPVGGTYDDLPVSSAGAVVVDAAALAVVEGGTSTVGVFLSDPPGGPVTVEVSLYGDADLSLTSSVLSFDDTNYSVPQPLPVHAAVDADTADGTALVRLRASGYQGTTVQVSETETDAHLDVSTSGLEISRAGGVGSFGVALGTPPAGAVTLTVGGGDPAALLVAPSTLTFTAADWHQPQSVTVTGVAGGGGGGVDVTVAVDEAVSDASYLGAAPATVEVELVGLDDGLVLHWPLDETSGSIVADASGRGHVGAVGADVALGEIGARGGAASSAGPGGGAGSFDDGVVGSSAFGAGLVDPSLDELTVSFWYRLPTAAHAGYLFTWGGSYNRADTVSIYLDPQSGLRLRVHDAGDSTSVESTAPAGFNDAEWHHIALVKDGAGFRFYLDGALAHTAAVGAGTITPGSGVTLGTNDVGRYGVSAGFDDLRLYGRALGAAEVDGLAALG
ncbi:MAG: LamG domain-containing protein, partial [Acidobacteriota bacterium]